MTPGEWKALWEEASSEKERAIIEADIWERRPENRTARKFEPFVSSIVGTSIYKVRMRRMILKSQNQKIWDAVDSGMSLGDAAYLSTNLDAHSSFEEAIESVKIPWRKRKPKNTKHTVFSEQTRSGKWSQVIELATEIAKEQMSDISDSSSISIIESMTCDIDLIAKDLERRIKKEKLRAVPQTSSCPSRKEVLEACRTLGIDPLSIGELPNLTVAFRQRGKKAKAYHSDVNRSEGAAEMYRSIVSSYDTLVALHDFMENK